MDFLGTICTTIQLKKNFQSKNTIADLYLSCNICLTEQYSQLAIQLIRKSCNLQGVVVERIREEQERWRKTFLRITCIVAVATLFSLVCQYNRREEQIRLITLLYCSAQEYNYPTALHTKVISITTIGSCLCFHSICSVLSQQLLST